MWRFLPLANAAFKWLSLNDKIYAMPEFDTAHVKSIVLLGHAGSGTGAGDFRGGHALFLHGEMHPAFFAKRGNDKARLVLSRAA